MLHLEIASFADVCMRRKVILILISKEINFNSYFCCISNIYLTPYHCEVQDKSITQIQGLDQIIVNQSEKIVSCQRDWWAYTSQFITVPWSWVFNLGLVQVSMRYGVWFDLVIMYHLVSFSWIIAIPIFLPIFATWEMPAWGEN